MPDDKGLQRKKDTDGDPNPEPAFEPASDLVSDTTGSSAETAGSESAVEEERAERIRRIRRRKELQRQRRKRQRIIRLAKAGVVVVAAILAIIGISAVVKKVASDKAAAKSAEAAEESGPLDTYSASEVLHLSFPVLQTEDLAAAQASEDTSDDADDEDGEDSGDGEAAPAYDPNTVPLHVAQFNQILQDLYDRDYVLIDPRSVVTSEEGVFSAAKVQVPKGKKPLILSQYDVSYNAGYNDYPDQMTRDGAGNITCNYSMADGTVSQGAVDVVPCVEAFIKAHADFSYNGARGIIGVTGYRGLLGWNIVRSEDAISTVAGTDAPQVDKDADLQNSKDQVSAVIAAARSTGWIIAANGYDLISYGSEADLVEKDADQWESVIGEIVGETDMLLLPLDADIGPWSGYDEENEKYTYLKDLGFKFFYMQDSGSAYYSQITGDYVRSGLHKINTYNDYTYALSLVG